MSKDELLKRLETIRCWVSTDPTAVATARRELQSLIEDLSRMTVTSAGTTSSRIT